MSVRDALQQAGESLGRELTPTGAELPGSGRANVLRVTSADGQALVLKTFDAAQAGEGWVRESAALATLKGRGLPVPDFIAAGGEPPWVLMSDLGAGPHLADALLGDDPADAEKALLDWAVALASLHSATASDRQVFTDHLAARAGDLPADVDTTGRLLADAADLLRTLLPDVGVTGHRAALDELRHVNELLGPRHALSPADTCPDNNLRAADGIKLLDFEGATFHHIAYDATYLTVPWPSCWCSWALPADVCAAAVQVWRAGVADAFPDAGDLSSELEIARTAWAFVSTSWFMENALHQDPPPTSARLVGLTPSRRAMIQHRLGGMVDRPTTALPALTGLAEQLLTILTRRWGAVPLAMAPAFRGVEGKG